jgi:hypothetical protein
LNWAGETDTIPFIAATSSETEATASFASPAPWASTTIVSGPLNPGPNAFASSSYARRSVVDVDFDSSPGMPSWSPAAGIASAPRRATPRVSTRIGRRSTNRAQRSPPWPSDLSARPPTRRADRDSTFSGTNPRIAGTSVSATSTATITAPAAASPILLSTGMPTTISPASAITTVRPAKTTADPAVPTASETASTAGSPRLRSSR